LEERHPIHACLILVSFAFAISMSSVIAFTPTAETAAPTWYAQATLLSASLAQGNFTIESLFIALTSDGDAVIEYDVRIPKTTPQRTNIELIGNTTEDLAISDYLGNPLLYHLNEKTKETSINSSRITNLLISYSTPDLVDKQDRIWTFSIDSPVAFTLKMPPESQIVKLGGSNSTSSARRIFQEDLLIFGPGNSQISYIIGPQGTDAEANAVIKSAELNIKDAMNSFPGINLTDPQNLLQRATVSKLNGQNLDATKYAIESNNIVQSTIEDYKSSQDTINEAEKELDKSPRTEANNEYSFLSSLNEAKAEFRNGQYDLARLSAEDLIIQLSQIQETSPGKPVSTPTPASSGGGQDNDENYSWHIAVYTLMGAATALALGIYLLVKKTRYHIRPSHLLSALPHFGINRDSTHRSNNRPSKVLSSSSSLTTPSKPFIPTNSSSLSTPSEALKSWSAKQTTAASFPPPFSASSTSPSQFWSPPDRSLDQKIKSILLDRPHLRVEDKMLLELLAEKQGAAFESDIRNKLLLPKTSVWRLVRRLEREELIEVLKVDSQNLIKLKV
jgi:hypothetical protein